VRTERSAGNSGGPNFLCDHFAEPLGAGMIALPGAAFTASILFDLLSLVAERPAQARAYRRGSADLLRFGVSSSLASLTLEVADYLHTPPEGADASIATRKLALNGAVIAIYLLDLAERQNIVTDERNPQTGLAVLPFGLSLLGLSLLGVSAKLQ
jgi:hypothetical protein